MNQSENDALFLPGAEDWELWEPTAPDRWQRTAEPRQPDACVYCFGVRSVCAIPLWVSSADPDQVRGLIRLQLEGRGMQANADAGEQIDFWTVRREADRTQILAVVLLEDPAEYGMNDRPTGFDVTPRLYDFPSDAIILWKELNQWIVAFTKGSELAHFQALSGNQLDDSALAELRCISEALQFQDLIDLPTRIEVRDPECPSEQARSVGKILETEAYVQRPTEPGLPDSTAGLIPASVAEKRSQADQKRKFGRWCMWGVIAYLAVMGSWASWLGIQHLSTGMLRNQMATSAPEATQVREAQARYEALRGAIDHEAFPLELFYRCAALLPERGVRLTQFTIEEDKIQIRGEASSSTEAVTWKATLTNSETLADYDWTFPPPEILPDNRARFIAEGTRIP